MQAATANASGCKALTGVSLPPSVTTIRQEAFENCEKLQEANLAACTKLTTIENSAFYRCKALTGISIPASVTSIGERTFWRCKALTSVTMKCKYNDGFGGNIFQECTALESGNIKVPADQVDTYKSHASDLGVAADRFAPLQP